MLYPDLEDPLGHRFGKLTSIAVVESSDKKAVPVGILFKCDCGRFRKVSIKHLKMGKPCPTACIKCEEPVEKPKPASMRVKYPSEYGTWRKDKRHFCKRWKGPGGFDRFMYDMGPRPAGMALCRINRKAYHSPQNSYWGQQNEDAAFKIPYGKKGFVTPHWVSRHFGVRLSFVYDGRRKGWSVEQIVAVWKNIRLKTENKTR